MLNNQTATHPRFLTYSCFAITLIAGISGTLLGPAFQSLAQRFSIPLENSGIFTGLQFIGITIAILATGRLLDRINARYALMGGSLLTGLGLLMIAGALSLPVALLGAFVLGLGYGIADVSANVVIAKLNQERAGSALSLLAFFYGLGAVLGPQLLNVALSQNNFTLAFTFTAVVSLLLTIPFSQSSLHIHQRDEASEPIGSTRINWWILLPFAALLFTYVGAEVGFSSWIVTQISTVALASASLATIGASLFWVALTSARGLGSIVLHRISEPHVLTLSIILVILGTLLLLAFPTSSGVALVSATIVGFGCGSIWPITVAMAGNIYPQSRGTVTGVIMAFGTLGGALLPWLQGIVGGGRSGGMEMVLILGIAMIGIEYFRPRPRKLAEARL